MKKIYLIYGVLWLIALIIVFWFSSMSNEQFENSASAYKSQFTKGQIVDIKNENFNIKLLDEENRVIRTQLNDFYIHEDYKAGDYVSVYMSESENGEIQYDITDYYHLDGLLLGFIVFCVVAVAIGRKKGFYSIISVLLSLFFFYGIMLSAIRAGFPVIPAGMIYVFLVTVLTIPLIHGFNKKSASAILAVNVGYIIGFLLTYFFTATARIGNAPSEEFRTLFIQFPDVDIRQILMVSLFLGAVGALIDVAVSICSAVFEGVKESVNLTFSKAYKLGMNVGKDILGSMINTLLIAYIASSFPFLVLITLAEFRDFGELLNYDFIALELTRIFIGAASIVLLIPITSVVTAYLVCKKIGVKE